MKKEDQMIDALLKEHARNGAGNDEAFLKSVQDRLDEAESGEAESLSGLSTQRTGGWSRKISWGAGVAAALTIGAVSYYGWKQEREQELVQNEKYDIPLSEVVVKSQPVQSAQPPQKRGQYFESQKKEGLRSVQRKPKAPITSTAKVIASNTVSESNLVLKEFEVGYVDEGDCLRLAGRLKSRTAESKRRGLRENRFFENGKCEVMPPVLNQSSTRVNRVSGNRYGKLQDNAFQSPWKAPLSTFSIDVDTASYAQIRSMIQNGQSVPADAVRIEEMINYFSYDYPQPEGVHPFSVNVETASCPWEPEHRLVKIGLKAKDMIPAKRPSANLVFLLDVSGSMNNPDKLPLLVDSMKILLKELNGDDSVSIVVYAGAQGVALPPTPVDADGRKKILKTLEDLQSGGSTNGGSGIKLAYKIAQKQFVKGGINRVILGTDGDFNVGMTDNASLVRLVENKAKSGIFLTVVGMGQGNLNDSMLEMITNKGNGNYAFIDSLREGRKVFLDDMMGTMVTVAKDVKIQVEFNPAKVKAYRLIGYANRMLKPEDFKNKRIDAGEIGAGHTVTAFYEIVPGNARDAQVVDDLKYQKNKGLKESTKREVVDSPEMLTVKLAYKRPDATKETESTYFNTPATDLGKSWKGASKDFQFASGVALFGMLQRHSEYVGAGDYALVKKLAESGRGKDPQGRRTEFSDLVRKVAHSN